MIIREERAIRIFVLIVVNKTQPGDARAPGRSSRREFNQANYSEQRSLFASVAILDSCLRLNLCSARSSGGLYSKGLRVSNFRFLKFAPEKIFGLFPSVRRSGSFLPSIVVTEVTGA